MTREEYIKHQEVEQGNEYWHWDCVPEPEESGHFKMVCPPDATGQCVAHYTEHESWKGFEIECTTCRKVIAAVTWQVPLHMRKIFTP